MKQKVITIFGTSKAGEQIFEQAYELGKALAAKGFAIANGGYGGTMEAAARGASENDGKVIGITCNAFKRSKPNEYVTDEVRTGSLPERLGKLVELGDGYIVLQGGTGTLLELAEVWELKNKRFFDSGTPIVLLGGFWEPLLDLMAIDDADSRNCLTVVDDVKSAVDVICREV